MVKIDNVHLRMREMFKPSMAELGLCMYQVANIQTHPIILTFKRPNMCTPLYQVANIQTSKKLHPKLNHGQSWGFKKELLEILYTFSLSHFQPQLDTLVQEHIPDLYVHFQSQVSFSDKLLLFIQNLNVNAGNPHEPLRKQLVLDSLHHLPLSSNRLQVIVLLSTSWSWSWSSWS